MGKSRSQNQVIPAQRLPQTWRKGHEGEVESGGGEEEGVGAGVVEGAGVGAGLPSGSGEGGVGREEDDPLPTRVRCYTLLILREVSSIPTLNQNIHTSTYMHDSRVTKYCCWTRTPSPITVQPCTIPTGPRITTTHDNCKCSRSSSARTFSPTSSSTPTAMPLNVGSN